MNEWASKLLSPLQGISDRNKADFDQFLVEVNNDQLEQMYFHKELDANAECRPTFDQLGMDRIIDETQKTLNTLKSLESILGERHSGFSSLNGSLLRARAAFEGFETTEGTLKLAADAFYIFSEQESTQSKQQIFLSDLKTSINQIRQDAQRKLSDYQKEISNAEKDVLSAEKRLAKSKDSQEKGVEYRNKLEAFELDGLLQNVRSKGRHFNESKRDLEDMAARLEKDVRDDIQHLLSTINRRDQVLAASRRAFQKLNRDCKRTIFYTLRKIVDKEKDFLETRRIVLEKFEQNVSQVNVDSDLDDFIENYRMEEGALSLQARALSLLDDLAPQMNNSYSNNSSAAPSSLPSPSSSYNQQQQQSLPPPPSQLFSSSEQDNVASGSSKRSGSILGGALSAMSQMMQNNSHSNNSNPSSNIAHPHSNQPHAPHNSLPLNLPTGTFLSKAADSNTPATPTQPSNTSAASAPFQQWEVAAYLSQIFYDSGEITTASVHSTSDGEQDNKHANDVSISNKDDDNAQSDEKMLKIVHRRARVQSNLRIQFHDVKTMNEQEFLKIETNRVLAEAVDWLITAVQTKKGRDLFIAELNQFRSRKVELGEGFEALGVILWKTLTYCQDQNDVHNSKIIMMLSQTFYRIRAKIRSDSHHSSQHHHRRHSTSHGGESSDDEDDDTPKRGVQHREYIKEKLMGHTIWEDGNFWEQALWQCAIEQLQTIPYEKPWYEMEKEARSETVRRVHDVVFSQVMAIIHSMMELGCQQRQTREFLYRMCVIHQLSEGQRQQLLSMILKR